MGTCVLQRMLRRRVKARWQWRSTTQGQKSHRTSAGMPAGSTRSTSPLRALGSTGSTFSWTAWKSEVSLIFYEWHWSQRSVCFFMNDTEVRGMFAFLLMTLKSEVNCSFVNHIEVRGELLFCKWQWSQRPVAFSWMTLKSEVSLLCSSPCPYSIVWHPWQSMSCMPVRHHEVPCTRWG